MKVYIRRWMRDKKNYDQEGPYEIDAYNGIGFTDKEEEYTTLEHVVKGRVQSMFLHAGQANALVVYVEDVERKEEV